MNKEESDDDSKLPSMFSFLLDTSTSQDEWRTSIFGLHIASLTVAFIICDVIILFSYITLFATYLFFDPGYYNAISLTTLLVSMPFALLGFCGIFRSNASFVFIYTIKNILFALFAIVWCVLAVTSSHPANFAACVLWLYAFFPYFLGGYFAFQYTRYRKSLDRSSSSSPTTNP